MCLAISSAIPPKAVACTRFSSTDGRTDRYREVLCSTGPKQGRASAAQYRRVPKLWTGRRTKSWEAFCPERLKQSHQAITNLPTRTRSRINKREIAAVAETFRSRSYQQIPSYLFAPRKPILFYCQVNKAGWSIAPTFFSTIFPAHYKSLVD